MHWDEMAAQSSAQGRQRDVHSRGCLPGCVHRDEQLEARLMPAPGSPVMGCLLLDSVVRTWQAQYTVMCVLGAGIARLQLLPYGDF